MARSFEQAAKLLAKHVNDLLWRAADRSIPAGVLRQDINDARPVLKELSDELTHGQTLSLFAGVVEDEPDGPKPAA